MQQVLFYVPLHLLWNKLPDLPIYGYGMMLFLAFVFCTLLAVRLARREGIPKEVLQDLAVWLFVSGILGARTVFMLQYGVPLTQFYQLWDGGLVFYGGPIGAVVGYYVAYFWWLRKYRISTWKLADVIAPCAALGLALGRVGCLLNGCCWGNVACADCPALHFPMPAPPTTQLVQRGVQTAAGFVVKSEPNSLSPKPIVESVTPGSAAELAGLKRGDKIIQVNDKDVLTYEDLVDKLRVNWPRGENYVTLSVQRAGLDTPVPIGPYRPASIGLHPTQVYETISMLLLLFFLVSYYPLKRYDGSVMVFFMIGYAVHRFLNEMLRNDTDPVAFNMTLSQNISILVLMAAVILGIVVWRRGPQLPPPDQPPPAEPTSSTTAAIPT